MRIIKIPAVALMLLALGGCDVVSVVGDVASSAVGASKELTSAGKTDAVVPVGWEETIKATNQAASRLALTADKQQVHPDQRKLIYHDDRDQEVQVTVVRRTSQMSEIHVDVGLFGAKGVGVLMLSEILRELPGTPEHARAARDAALKTGPE